MYKIFSKRTNSFIGHANSLEEVKDTINELELLDHNNGEFFPNTYTYIKIK